MSEKEQNKKSPSVFVEGNDWSIVNMFQANGWLVTKNLEEADLVCFQGGADVSPELYGEPNTGSYNQWDIDFLSIVLYNNAKRLGIPMVGICRGGQFLNVMAGGKMIQDYPGHAIPGTHVIHMNDGNFGHDIEVTSTHHQVMVPGQNQTVIGWANNEEEVEIVWNEKDETLSFQPHPEYVYKEHECQTLFFDLIREFFSLEAENNSQKILEAV